MRLGEKISDAYKYVSKAALLVLIPVFMDIATLFTYEKIFQTNYIGPDKFFIFKFGTISAPPSIDYLLENFPSLFIKFNTSYGSIGLITSITLFNILLMLSLTAVLSFLKSGYLSLLEGAGHRRIGILDFFEFGNKNWYKFLVLDLVSSIFVILMIKSIAFAYVSFVLIILYYVKYSIVVDDMSLWGNIKAGIHILFNNLGFTIKMVIIYGLAVSCISPIIFSLCKGGPIGIIFSIILVDYFGMIINKAVLEIYRELRHQDEISQSMPDESINQITDSTQQ